MPPACRPVTSRVPCSSRSRWPTCRPVPPLDADAVELRRAAHIGDVHDLATVRRPRSGSFPRSGCGSRRRASTAAGVGHIQFRVAVLAAAHRQVAAVGRESRAGVRTREFDHALALAAGEIDHVDVRVPALVAGVGEAASVRAECGADADGGVAGKLAQIAAVGVAEVNFLVPRLSWR